MGVLLSLCVRSYYSGEGKSPAGRDSHCLGFLWQEPAVWAVHSSLSLPDFSLATHFLSDTRTLTHPSKGVSQGLYISVLTVCIYFSYWYTLLAVKSWHLREFSGLPTWGNLFVELNAFLSALQKAWSKWNSFKNVCFFSRIRFKELKRDEDKAISLITDVLCVLLVWMILKTFVCLCFRL